MPPGISAPPDPVCKYFSSADVTAIPMDSSRGRGRKKNRFRPVFHPSPTIDSSSRKPSFSFSRSFPFLNRLSALADPLDYVLRLFSPQGYTTLRTSRSLRQAMRKASYLHILLLPALLLLFLEMPRPVPHSPGLFPDEQSASRASVANLGLEPLARAIAPDHAVRSGISIVACCMNRHETLRAVLREWRFVRNVSEILVVDWSSDPPLRDVVEHVADGDQRVRLIRVDGEDKWILSRAYNLAVRSASFDKIIRMDCDYSINRDFIQAHDLGNADINEFESVFKDGKTVLRTRTGTADMIVSPRFYAGNFKHARNENEVHLNGAVYIRRADFLHIGGYDERIQTYGWDDEDLYKRLVLAGLEKQFISYDHVSHVPHGDGARAQKDVKFVQVEIDLNELLLRHLPKWNQSLVDQNEWALSDHAPTTHSYAVLTARSKPAALKDLVSDEKVQAAWDLALGQRLANDYQIPWDIMSTMSVDSKRKLLTRLNKRMTHRSSNHPARVLFAHCMHGLGNRLRALASAMSFANQTDRELVLIWETDAHIAANFTDLFQDDLVVLTHFKPKWPFRGYDQYDKAWLNFEFFNYMEMEGEGAIKGQKIVDKPDKHFYFKSAYVMEANSELTNWDKDNAMLRSLQPVPTVLEMIKRLENNGLENMIGIHIRDRTLDRDIKNVNFGTEYGDAASKEMEYWRKKSSYKTFIAEMRRQLRKDPSLRFYVATDTVEVIPKLQAEFPGKVLSTERNCDGRDGYCVKFALVDIICLSKTKELIGSNWSSFTEAASRFGGKKARLAGEHFDVDSK